MKKTLLNVTACVVLSCLTASAADFEVDGICYNIIGENAVEVTANKTTAYAGEVTVPAQVVNDGTTYAVTAVGAEAFSMCFTLTKVTLPESVTLIDKEAFYFCATLADVNFPAAVTEIGEKAFMMCSKITELNLPAGLKTIGKEAFISCFGNTAINIPDAVVTMGEYAFYNNSAAKTLTIGAGLKSLPDYAFAMCSGLTDVAIPEGVESLGKYSFSSCSGMKSVKLPSTLKRIDNYAFKDCTALSDIDFPDGVEYVGRNIFGKTAWETAQPEGLILIKDYVAYLQNSTLPEGSEVTLPATVRVLAGSAFERQVKLKSITLPESLVSIGAYALNYCNSLESLTVPDNVVEIGDNAMQYCISIASLSLGAKLAYIGANAFSAVMAKEITSYNPVPPTVADVAVFDIDVYTDAKLSVPGGSMEAYKSAAVWEQFVNVEAIPGTDGIADAEADGCGIAVGADGTVTSACGGEVAVYTCAGALVARGSSPRITVPGLYIATDGKTSRKIAVK